MDYLGLTKTLKKSIRGTMSENIQRMTVVGSSDDFRRLQRAWTRSGEYANRSQFIKAAVNSFAHEEIFQ